MTRHWVSQFQKLPLSKAERQILGKFEADPAGLGFLPLADVLKAHKLYDEALELMSEGVTCLLYTSPSPRDRQKSRMPSSA